MSMASSRQKRSKPRGIWKAQRVIPPRLPAREFGPKLPPRSASDSDSDRASNYSTTSTASKRKPRRQSPLENTSKERTPYSDYSRRSSPDPNRVDSWVTRTKIMDTSTTAGRGLQRQQETFDHEDWEDLKELFAKTAEQYENDEASEALPLLRGVIHECHRILLAHDDPSDIFMNRPAQSDSPLPTVTITPPSQQPIRNYGAGSDQSASATAPKERKSECIEVPTAFHAILGTALFLFGTIIAQYSELALPGEPDNPVPYWLAALDVFETGENLPSRVSGQMSGNIQEDWRMAIVWGRVLVSIADETITRAVKARQAESSMGEKEATSSERLFPTAYFAADEPKWPPESPFSAIVARRPITTCRMSLSTATPNDLMMLAMDQFSRGIFHMPHPRRMQMYQASGARASSPPVQEPFSRAKELFTIASEVLMLSEKLEIPSERKRWASWADSVFSQMKMEADMDAWRGPITRARGRCLLIVGAALAEELEAALEQGEMDVLKSEDAEEARDGLLEAISFFERAKGSATATAVSDPAEARELQSFLAEALLNLANLTEDEGKREELYARAQLESGGDIDLLEDDGAMEED